jgi:hypothetical protein
VLARPPTTRRTIPAAANADRVVVNGGWSQWLTAWRACGLNICFRPE